MNARSASGAFLSVYRRIAPAVAKKFSERPGSSSVWCVVMSDGRRRTSAAGPSCGAGWPLATAHGDIASRTASSEARIMRLLLLVPHRVVGWIDVVDVERAERLDLHD